MENHTDILRIQPVFDLLERIAVSRSLDLLDQIIYQHQEFIENPFFDYDNPHTRPDIFINSATSDAR